MPFLILALLFVVLLTLIVGIALSIVSRYRAGTARREGRRWIATVNVWTTALAATFFLIAAACTSIWVHQAFVCAVLGIAAGGMIGILGLSFTRWEARGERLYYTPSRWMAFLIVGAIAGRLVYAWSRGLHTTSAQHHTWLNLPGTAISLAVAAAVIGYYLVYAVGVRQRLVKHQRLRTV
ncbi:MAG: DUF1453 family protein [Verrucomicrobia bacterium]|nr:DUF1453 family protein [Verrucomicrobiota bacterium]